MEKTVQELKMIIRELILEVGDLKERVARLENDWSTQEREEPPMPSRYAVELVAEGYDNLGKIYNEGYHVCSMAYGQHRDGECLFCLAFMEKE